MSDRFKGLPASGQPPARTGLYGAFVAICLVAGVSLSQNTGIAPSPQNPDMGRTRQGLTPPGDESRTLPELMTTKRQAEDIQANLAKSKKDASELAALAKQLQQELDKPNANSLSSANLLRIERIQKLAKKIRDETKGY